MALVAGTAGGLLRLLDASVAKAEADRRQTA
jgi:hypothetical protein